MKVSKLTELVATELTQYDECPWTLSEIIELLDPPREPNSEVKSEFLLVEYVAHVPQILLHEFSFLQEIEDRILSVSGITNAFTSVIIPIVQGEVRRFSVSYSDARGVRIVFDKAAQLADPEPFGRQHPNLKLEWK